MQKKATVIITLILALAATGIVYVVLNRAAPTVPVVVAVKNLALGAQITDADVAVENMPATAVPSTSFGTLNKVVGQTVSGGPILANDIVRAEHLSAGSSLYATLKSLAPAGWVAVQLPANKSQQSHLRGLKRGDVIDIFGETASNGGIGIGCICQGAIVLQVPSEDIQKNTNNTVQQYIIAVPAQYASIIAETTIRDKAISLVLPDRTGQQNKVSQPATPTPAPTVNNP